MIEPFAMWLERRNKVYRAGYDAGSVLTVGSTFLGPMSAAEQAGYTSDMEVAYFAAGYRKGMYVAGLRPGCFHVDWNVKRITWVRP